MDETQMVPIGTRLKEAYLRKLERNSAYSLRAFSRDLRMSHSHLGRVMAGKRNLSLAQAAAIADRLALAAPERAAFLQSATEAAIASARRAPAPRPDKETFLTLEVDRFRVLSDWYHGALLEIVTLKDFKPSASWAARKLGLTTRQVQAALGRLQRLGLLEVSKESWKRTSAHIVVPSQASSAIRAYHKQMLEKATESLETAQPEARDITGTTIAFDPARLPEVKERIRKFRKSLMELAAEGNPSDLFQLNVQLFSLTKGRRS